MRLRVCEWLAEQLLGSSATLQDLVHTVPTFQVFREPDAGVPSDLREAMDSMCRFVGEMPPRTYHLWYVRTLNPASGHAFALEGASAPRLPVETGVAPGLPGTLLS